VDDFVGEFEWQISNTETAFPFTEEVAATGASFPLSHVIADAAICIPQFDSAISLYSLSKAEAGANITLASGSSRVVFYGAVASDYGVWRILSWHDNRGMVRLTLLRERISGIGWPVFPRKAVFVPYVIQELAAGLDTLTVKGQILSGDIALRLGYNMEAASSVIDGVRPGTGLELTASGGLGEGAPPCETECPRFIRRINSVGPGSIGNFSLEGEDCYSVTREEEDSYLGGIIVKPAALRIRNSCGPCCDCTDYGLVYTDGLKPLIEKGQELAARYQELVDSYSGYVKRMEEVVACKSVPEVKLQVTGQHSRSAYVAIGLFNNSGGPWPMFPTPMTVTFQSDYPGTPQVVDDLVYLHRGEGPEPWQAAITGISAEFVVPTIPCCSVVWITFSLVWNGTGPPINFAVDTMGVIDDVSYNLRVEESTLAPVNRER
jgi:hypothetical protein